MAIAAWWIVAEGLTTHWLVDLYIGVSVRLVQSPAHLRCLALYTKCGFDVQEPLVLMQDGRAAEGLITGKGNKDRVVFFDESSLGAIWAYLEARCDSYIPLYVRHDDGRGRPGPRGERWRLSPQSVWGVVKKYGALAGVEGTTHHLRHLKARTLLNQGAQLAEVQDILGHASPETTKKIYAHYTTRRLREAFDRYSLDPDEVAARLRRRERT